MHSTRRHGHAAHVEGLQFTRADALTLRAALRFRRRASAKDTPLLLKASPAHTLAKHVAVTGNNKHGANLDHSGDHGASRGWYRRVAAAAGCVICANTRADHACGNRTQHAAAGMSWATTRRRTDSWPVSTAKLLRTPRAPATRCCTCERHLRALAREAALDSIAPHAACACCHERGGACRAAASMPRCCCSGHHLRAHLYAQPAGWSMLKSASFTGGVPPPAGARLTASIRRAALGMHGGAMSTSVAAHNRKLDTTWRALWPRGGARHATGIGILALL